MSKTLAGDKETDRKIGELEKEVTDLKRKATEKEKIVKDLEQSKQTLESETKYTRNFSINSQCI